MFRWILRMLIGCKHDWKVIDKTDLPSGYEQIVESRMHPHKLDCGSIYLFTKQSTTVIACSKCGATQIVRTRNLTRWD